MEPLWLFIIGTWWYDFKKFMTKKHKIIWSKEERRIRSLIK